VGNQLRAAIKRNLREYSYYLENQFDVLLNAKQEIKCSYKPCGKAFCLNFSLEGYPFTLLIDINSSIANSWFDISEVV
jgi:hypothetical protein